jgi:Tol biopolymer transport system component
MNADGSEQIQLTNNIRADFFPDWGPATEPANYRGSYTA